VTAKTNPTPRPLRSISTCSSTAARRFHSPVATVEPEADLLAFLEHARLHRSRTEMVFDQHVRDARLLALEPHARKNPVGRLTVGVVVFDQSVLSSLGLAGPKEGPS